VVLLRPGPAARLGRRPGAGSARRRAERHHPGGHGRDQPQDMPSPRVAPAPRHSLPFAGVAVEEPLTGRVSRRPCAPLDLPFPGTYALPPRSPVRPVHPRQGRTGRPSPPQVSTASVRMTSSRRARVSSAVSPL
jgi:hypothetical protein